ncbi:MAG: hypothetical protein ONB23_09515 [candidate division KSB1 bacterium]|nr:hypothetical protein [candidate division KSB1 bacterium]
MRRLREGKGGGPEIQPPPSLLSAAKQFLCWDRFPDLSIQLIRMGRPVGYWFPPAGRHSVILFYTDDRVEEALFLLFHEVGHYLTWEPGWEHRPKERSEVLAWERGRAELLQFLAVQGLDQHLLAKYDAFACESLRTYGIDPTGYRLLKEKGAVSQDMGKTEAGGEG